jgi:hypothetical protein
MPTDEAVLEGERQAHDQYHRALAAEIVELLPEDPVKAMQVLSLVATFLELPVPPRSGPQGREGDAPTAKCA